MNFELFQKKGAMKKLFIMPLTVLTALLFISAVKVSGEDKLSRSEKKTARQRIVKEAVESRRFVIEFDRLYMYRYGRIDLSPGKNFILISGNKAAIRAGYMGRQIGFMPIAGIRLAGEPVSYRMEKNSSKGTYRIEMDVKGDADTFHISILIGENGSCNTTISANRIDQVRYTGTLVPMEKEEKVPEPDAIRI